MRIDGTWQLTIDTPLVRELQVKLYLESDENSVVGRLADDTETFAGKVVHGVVDGDRFSLKIRLLRPVPSALRFAGTFDGDFMEGSVRVRFFGGFKARARRVA